MTDPDQISAELDALGKALKALRTRSGLGQQAAAQRIGIRNVFLSQIENGRRGMRWATLLACLRTYDATLADLGKLLEADD
jgi:transcriptional regulator with XRE-family HTH domain